jgi:dimethylhistidine N-methyltransferase
VECARLDQSQAIETSGIDGALRDEVLRGLLASPKTLPPKLFYDANGAALFERITTLPEYYLTRAELEILRARAGEIAELAGSNCALIEYGSGAGTKVRLLLDALQSPAAYVPIDISVDQLAEVASEISVDYPDVAVLPVAADFTTRIELPQMRPGDRRLAFFPGSTIGNFAPLEAAALMRRIRDAVGPDGALILGVDRVKETAVLNAAYNDSQGVTAAFNLNVLARLERELRADIDLDCFAHRAFFDRATSRIEMHLVSLAEQTVTVAGAPIHFATGETIWTESSYKYDESMLESLAESAGFTIARLWTDESSRFCVAFLRVA